MCDQFPIYLSIAKTNKMHNISQFILFWNNTVHVSDGLSAHHQESDDGRRDRPNKHIHLYNELQLFLFIFLMAGTLTVSH
jgi:hypothetical protein